MLYEVITNIPKEGPVVVVANHPHGMVDGMILAELIGRTRLDYRVITSYSIHYTKLYDRRRATIQPRLRNFCCPENANSARFAVKD